LNAKILFDFDLPPASGDPPYAFSFFGGMYQSPFAGEWVNGVLSPFDLLIMIPLSPWPVSFE
jgi:hypothetical protein